MFFFKVSVWVSLFLTVFSFSFLAQAQQTDGAQQKPITTLSDFFEKDLPSPFVMSLQDLQKQIEEMRLVCQQTVRLGTDVEVQQVTAFNSILKTGYTPEKFMAEFSEHLDRLPADFIAAVQPGKPMVDLEQWIEKSPEVRATFEFVMAARKYVEPFDSSLNPHNVSQIDLALAMGLMMVHEQILVYRKMASKGDTAALQKIQSLYARLIEKRDSYAQNRHEYGQPKFSFAIAPSNTFLGMLKTTSIKIVQEIAPNNEVAARKNESFWKRLSFIVRKIPPFVKTLYYVYQVRKHVHNVTQPTADENKLSASVNGMARNLGDLLDYEVEVIGKNNLANGLEPNEHLFINSNHRDGLRDLIAFAKLGIDNVLMFAAVPNFFPNTFKKNFGFFKIDKDLREYKTKAIGWLNKNFGIIVVGKGPQNPNPVDPTSKALEAIDRGLGKIILSYPQGGLPSISGAENPIQPKYFTYDGMIENIRQKKMKRELEEPIHRKVRLQPMLFTYNMDPYNLGLNGAEKSKLTVEVFPSIPDRVSAMLTVFGGTDAMGMLYRFGAVAKQVTNESLLFGQVRASQLEEVLRQHMNSERLEKVTRSCRFIF